MIKYLNLTLTWRIVAVAVLSVLISVFLISKNSPRVEAFDVFTGNLGIGESGGQSDTTAPTVSVTTPASGAILRGLNNIIAQANDNVGVTNVEFYVDNTIIGTNSSAPYSLTWDTSVFSNAWHSILARAYDAAGNVGTSSSLTVLVDNLAPTVAVLTPANNSQVSGIVQMTADATDNNSVTSVEYFVDSSSIGVGGTGSNYSKYWISTAVGDGVHEVKARATDIAGNVTDSSNTSITVDNNAPVVEIISPTNFQTVSGIFELGAIASDSAGVTSVEFYVDGNLIGEDTSAPYTYMWDTTVYPHNSAHVISAKAYDVGGHVTTTSDNKFVTVLDIIAPTVNITSPLNGAVVPRGQVTVIQASSADVSGIQKVEFRVNGNLKCTDTTAPYSCNWSVPAQRNKSYNLQAKSYDNAGRTATHTISVTSSN